MEDGLRDLAAIAKQMGRVRILGDNSLVLESPEERIALTQAALFVEGEGKTMATPYRPCGRKPEMEIVLSDLDLVHSDSDLPQGPFQRMLVTGLRELGHQVFASSDRSLYCGLNTNDLTAGDVPVSSIILINL